MPICRNATAKFRRASYIWGRILRATRYLNTRSTTQNKTNRNGSTTQNKTNRSQANGKQPNIIVSECINCKNRTKSVSLLHSPFDCFGIHACIRITHAQINLKHASNKAPPAQLHLSCHRTGKAISSLKFSAPNL